MSKDTPKEDPAVAAGAPLSPLTPEPTPLEGAWRYALSILMALYLCFASIHALTTPTGLTGLQNAPDEAAHVFYAKELHAGRYPTQQSVGSNPLGYEWHQPPLYYFAIAQLTPLGEKPMRFVSIGLGLLSLWLIFQVGRRLFPTDPLIPTIATGFAALLPTHIAITSTVNNDAPTEVLFSCVLLILVTSFRGGFTANRALYLGLAVGLALLVKATALLLILITLFALVLLKKNGQETRQLLSYALLSMGVVLILSGWWFVRNGMLYGEVLPLQSFKRAFAGTAKASDFVQGMGWGGYLSWVGQWTFQSFFAVFGTPKSAEKGGIPIFLPTPIYGIFAVWVLAVFAGITRLHFKRYQLFSLLQLHGIWTFLATIGLVLASFVFFILTYFQAQGRYLYPALLPISLMTTLGWLALFPEKSKKAAGLGWLVFLGLIAVLYLFMAVP